MKNVTISIKESVEKFARLRAAKRNKSLSRFISELLEEEMRREEMKSVTLEEFFSQPPYLTTKGESISRDELYDRKVLR